MNHGTRIRRVVPLLFLLVTLACGVAIAQTQSYSGLQNRDLGLDVNSKDVLMNLTMVAECNGSVTRVKVTEDTETQLKLGVTYKSFEGCVLTGRLVDKARKPLGGFKPVVQTLSESDGTVELTFDIESGSYPVNQDITVPRIYFTVGKAENASNYYRAAYNLNKKFKIPPPPTDIVTEVTATPLGSAANIQRTATRPSVVGLPQIKIYQKLEKIQPNSDMIKTKSLYLKNVEGAKLNIEREAPASSVVKVSSPRMMTTKPLYLLDRPAIHRVTPDGTTPPRPPDPNPQGPDDRAIPLFESLVTDYDFEYPFEITNIRLDVYPDKNKASGVFYFIPAAYNLLYEKDHGVQFVIDYGTAASGDTGQTVRMAGKLSPGIGKKEIDVVKELVKAYVRRNPQLGYATNCELRAIQIAGSPAVNFDTDLRQYHISNQTVSATSLSEPLDISWRTDQANATDISNSLKANVGIIGTMTLKPQGGSLSDQTIPVRIRLADERTIGRITLGPGWREQNWRNPAPYPIKLKNLHVLWVNGDIPAVYTWLLGDHQILPGSQAHIHGESVPQWLDNEPYARFWFDYEIETCEPCHESVIRSVIHSTVRPQAQQIKFKLLSFFQEFQLNSMVINVRTKQADAPGEALQSLPAIEVPRDAQDYLSANIYVPAGGAPVFEFQLQVIQADGKSYDSKWQPRGSLLVPIGSSQIRELFPQLVP